MSVLSLAITSPENENVFHGMAILQADILAEEKMIHS